jgi:cytochrome c oxidase cbb3-type subunit III
MSSRCRPVSLAIAACALLAIAACEREAREIKTGPDNGPEVGDLTLTDLYAGQPAPPPPDPRASGFDGNAFHISQGQRYFQWYNCNGCHANGGGGMGPPLMDDQWRYGAQMEQIRATILQGRPNGMPSFRGKIPDQQVWQIAAYVRSLSAQTREDATPSRADTMQSTPPLNQQDRRPPSPSDPAATQVPAT